MVLVPRTGHDEDHATFRESVRHLVTAQVVPDLEGWRAAGRFDRSVFEAAGEQGFLGTSVAERFGGSEVDDPRFPVVLVEELTRAGATGLALVLARQLGVVVPVLAGLADGSDQAAAWLTGLAEGGLVGCVAVVAEDGTARAVPGAAVADVFVLVGPDRGLRVVGRDRVSVEPGTQLGGAEAATGDLTAPTVLAEPAEGIEVEPVLDLWTAVVSVAAARAALDLTSAYVHERAVFGKPLSTFENTRFRLAEVGAELAAAQQLVDAAVDALGTGTLDAGLAAAARIVAARVQDAAVDQGMQLHGGYGYMREYPISHAFGDARFVRVAAAAVSEPRAVLASALGL